MHDGREIMASITKRRDTDGRLRYRAQVRLRGSQPVSETFDTLAQARKWGLDVEAGIRSGTWLPPSKGGGRTVADAIERFRRDELPRRKASTQDRAQYLLAWCETHFGPQLLCDITPALILEARAELLADGRSPATCNRNVHALAAVLSACVRWEWIDNNPCRKVARLTEGKGRVRYLTQDERTRLLAGCAASQSAALFTVVALALSTGARRGEILGLRWKDVSLADGLLVFRGTKNGDDRSVPVEGKALDALREWGKVRPFNGDALMFPSADGKRPASLRQAFERALGRAEINDFRWHDMRHDAASRLVMAGCTLRDVQEMLGHKTASMTIRYSHLSPDHMRRVAAKAAL